MNENELSKTIKEGIEFDQDSEDSFKQIIVVPLLGHLGYNIKDKNEVKIQVTVKLGTKTNKADYKICSNRKDCFILEIKAPTIKIDENKDVLDQTYSYAKLLDCKYGVIYNGKKLILISGTTQDQILYRWDSSESPNDLSIFKYLSKENFPDKLDQFLENFSMIENLKNYLSNLKNLEILKSTVIEKILLENRKFDKKFLEENLEINILLKKEIVNTLPVVVKDLGKNIFEIFRNELQELPEGDVIIVPAQAKINEKEAWGINYLKKYNIWEAIRINKSKINNIKYIAFYLTKPESRILYFAEVSKIIDANDETFRKIHDLPPIKKQYIGKKAIEIKEGSLRKLKDPIVASSGKGGGIRNVIYTDLQHFISAKNVRDLHIDRWKKEHPGHP